MPTQLICGCCFKSFEISDQDRTKMNDVQCPHCGKWNEIHRTEGKPPSSRLSYYLECKEQ